MYSMLIVDDEPLITDGFYDLFIENRELDLDIYKAYSGKEALDWINKAKFDIVLTDISMPEINGFIIHEKIKKVWPECKVIFLTSYNDFDYIHQALRNKTADYILKSEGDTVVLDAVKKVILQIESERKNEELLKQASENFKLTFPLLQSKFILDLAEGWEFQDDEIIKQFDDLEITLNIKNSVYIMLCKVNSFPENLTLSEKMKSVYYLKNLIDNYFSKVSSSISVVFQRSSILILLQPLQNINIIREDEGFRFIENLFLFIKGSMSSLQSLAKEAYDLTISLSTFTEAIEWNNLSNSFDFLKMKLSTESGLSDAMLLIYNLNQMSDQTGQLLDFSLEMEVRNQLKKIRPWMDFLENNEKDNFFHSYYKVMSIVGKSKNTPFDHCAEVFYLIAGIFIAYLNKYDQSDFKEILSNEKLFQFDPNISWDDYTEFFGELATKTFKQKSDDSLKNANRIFKFIRHYAEQNISEDLSLTKFADLLNFHPFYLSRLFKQVTGLSLSDYISEVKLKKAKDLLANSNLKVNDITTALGFKTSSYFTKFFRKYTDQSPLEYRKHYGEGIQND